MKRISRVAVGGVAGALALAVVGCGSDGLSPREVRGHDYASYVFSMYDSSQLAGDDAAAAHKPIPHAAKIAVAQLGEVAPPSIMLDKLRKDAGIFASVQPVSGVIDTAPTRFNRDQPADYSAQQDLQSHANRMRAYARDLGADYLFLYGGTVDHATTDSPLRLADATIIGAFVVPGQVIQAEARATGSLIDVKTGRVVLSVSADGHDRRRSPTVAVEGDEIKMLEDLRDQIVVKLADQLTDRVKDEAARG